MIQYFQDCFLNDLASYETLRKSFIHNDINDQNIIITKNLVNPDVKGIIDFGDTLKNQTINDCCAGEGYQGPDVVSVNPNIKTAMCSCK